jgi:hypothetical protein
MHGHYRAFTFYSPILILPLLIIPKLAVYLAGITDFFIFTKRRLAAMRPSQSSSINNCGFTEKNINAKQCNTLSRHL